MKKKIFLVFSLVTLLSAVMVFASGILAVRLSSNSAVRERLTSETQLVAALISDESDFSKLDSYKATKDFRVTIFDLDGNAIYETDTDAELENHSEREEFISALNGKPEIVERYSQTLGYKMNYYAVKTQLENGKPIVIRLAVRNTFINSYVNVSLPVFFLLLLIVLGLSFEAGSRIAGKIAGRMEEIGESIKSVSSGSYSPIKADSREPEIYAIINNINELNAGIHQHILQEETERHKLGAVLDNVSQGIIAVNDANETVFINKSALAMFGDKSDKTKNNEKKDLIYFIDNLDLYAKLVAHRNGDFTFDFRFDDKDLEIAVNKIQDVNLKEEIAEIIIISDVTVQKSVAREKSDFFANASHELKTPVTVMQGLTEILLQKNNCDEFTEKKLNTIHNECLRLASIISDMLKLSSLERPFVSDDSDETSDLKQIATEVVTELSPRAEEKHLTFSIRGEAQIKMPRKNAFELISNLCSNAVNYNRENGSIDIILTQSSDGASLTVTDTGIGIEEEHLPRLCERFYRVDKSRSKKTGGTGLGLAIVKHICMQYGAELAITSVYGKGTSVKVTFDEKNTPKPQ